MSVPSGAVLIGGRAVGRAQPWDWSLGHSRSKGASVWELRAMRMGLKLPGDAF